MLFLIINLKIVAMKKIVHLLLILPLITFVSCNNDDNGNLENEQQFQPNGIALKSLFASNLNNIKQQTTFDSGQNFVFVSEKGTVVKIFANCMTKLDDTPVTGNVDFEFIEIYDRGTMLATNKATVGKFGTEKRMLASGGEFHFKVSQNGETLKPSCHFQIITPAINTGGLDSEMQGFVGTIDENGNLLWENFTGQEMWSGFNQEINQDAYTAFLNNFGWYNHDRFIDLGNGYTDVTYVLPQGFNASNSSIFMASKTIPNSLANAYVRAPIGLELYYILVVESNGGFKYAIKPAQFVTQNMNVVFTLPEMQNGSIQQVIDAINNLPQ